MFKNFRTFLAGTTSTAVMAGMVATGAVVGTVATAAPAAAAAVNIGAVQAQMAGHTGKSACHQRQQLHQVRSAVEPTQPCGEFHLGQ